jgi:hypothetical protein
MFKLSDRMLQDEDEMRSFYRSLGMSEVTIENAIKARRLKPVGEEADTTEAGPKNKTRHKGKL